MSRNNARSIDNPNGQTDWSTVFDDEPDESLEATAREIKEQPRWEGRKAQEKALAEAGATTEISPSARAAWKSRREAEPYRNQAARENPTVAIEGGHAFKDLRDPALVDAPGELTDEPAAEPAEPPEGFSEWDVDSTGKIHYRVKGDVGYSYTYDSTNDTFTIDEGSATGGGAVIGPGSPAHTAIKAQMKDPTTYRADIPSKTAASKALAGEAAAEDVAIDEEQAGYAELQAHLGDLPEYAPELGESLPDEPGEGPGEASAFGLIDEGFTRQRLEGVSADPHVEGVLGGLDPDLIGGLVKPSGLVNLYAVDQALRNDEFTLEDWQLIEGALKKQGVINVNESLSAARDREEVNSQVRASIKSGK